MHSIKIKDIVKSAMDEIGHTSDEKFGAISLSLSKITPDGFTLTRWQYLGGRNNYKKLGDIFIQWPSGIVVLEVSDMSDGVYLLNRQFWFAVKKG